MGLKFGGLIGDGENCASRGDKWVLIQSLIDDDDDGMDEVEVP